MLDVSLEGTWENLADVLFLWAVIRAEEQRWLGMVELALVMSPSDYLQYGEE